MLSITTIAFAAAYHAEPRVRHKQGVASVPEVTMRNDERLIDTDEAPGSTEEIVRPDVPVSEADDDGDALEDRDAEEDEDDRAGIL